MRTVVVALALLGGCSLLPKQVSDKGADFLIGYCTTASPVERAFIRNDVNTKAKQRCAEKKLDPCPAVCAACDGNFDSCKGATP